MAEFASTQEQRDEAQRMADERTAEALNTPAGINVIDTARAMCEEQGKEVVELDDHRVTKFVAYALQGKEVTEAEVKKAIQLWIDTVKY